MRFLALGDSYTIGEGVTETERWPAQLAQMLRNHGIETVDLTIVARTGWTTGELQAGIDEVLSTGNQYQLVTLLIGVNNQYRALSQIDYRREFKALLEQAIEFAGGEPGRVIVMSIPDWGKMPFAVGQDQERIAVEIDSFNAINRAETGQLGANYIDVTSISRRVAGDPTYVTVDDLHPSGKMYAEWADLLLPVVISVVGNQ